MTANGGTTFDLDAAGAARREAAGEGFKFIWKKKPYVCLPPKEWPITVTSSLSEGDLVGAISEILGEKQAVPFLKGNPTTGDVEALMEAIAKHTGVDGLGE